MMLALDPQNRPIARLQLLNEDGKRLEPEDIVVSRGRKVTARATVPRTRPARVK
jgi:hypothetical protein